MKDENKDEYFIIKKHKWFDHTSYEIMKAKPFDQTQAIRILLAYEQLNDNKDTTYHLNKVEQYFEEPKDTLVLTKDMEVN
jgi:hypothetical protein|tara:strand:+ start:622 stop:861 length:240 start_codon:yes stop_codon:yes gene_type:complete